MNWPLRFSFWLCLWSAACAGSHPQRATRVRAALPGLERARQLAPDYAVSVDGAWQAAERAPTPQAREAQLRRVQWLALAAQAEAERVATLRQAPAFEARLEQATLARARAERQRLALERARVLERASAAEQREARWVFAALARDAVARPEPRDRAWEFLVRRAQALCSAARALGAPAADLNQVDLQLTAARTAAPAARVREARRALSAAQRALGLARAAREPGPAERRDLRERLQERGFVLHDRALLVIELGAAGPSGAAARELMRRVSLLDDLLPAFPHGPIVLSCAPRAGCAPSWFGSGLRERVRIEEAVSEPADQVVRVALPAYAEGPAAPMASATADGYRRSTRGM